MSAWHDHKLVVSDFDGAPVTQMRLTLLAPDPVCRPAMLSVLVGQEAFRIGRATDNDWILPPATVSRHQALIRYVKPNYFVENLSATCPLAVGSSDRCVAPGDCQTLVPGEPIWIDDLEIATEIIDAVRREEPKPLPAAGTPPDILTVLLRMVGEPLDPSRGRGASDAPAADWWRPREQGTSGTADNRHTDAARVLLRALCEGARLDPASIELTPERARQLGGVLRATVSGVLQLVQARRVVKNELGLSHTRINVRANNPFRVSSDEVRLLEQLFAAPQQGFVPADAALEDAFVELLHHQIALIEALRRAFDHLLQQLAPEALVGDGAERRRGLLARLRRAPDPAWEHYRALHEKWLSDPDWAYRRLFGDMLARTYESQCEKLRRMRKHAGRPTGTKEQAAHE